MEGGGGVFFCLNQFLKWEHWFSAKITNSLKISLFFFSSMLSRERVLVLGILTEDEHKSKRGGCKKFPKVPFSYPQIDPLFFYKSEREKSKTPGFILKSWLP